MKKRMSLLLALVLVFSLLAGGQALAVKETDETLRVCITEEPATLMKGVAEIGASALYVHSAMVDTLLVFDAETGEIQPNIATAWEWIDDTHLQVTIRDDVMAHNGSFITSEDIVYTAQIGAESGITDYNMIDPDECSVVDDYTAVIGLKMPYATLCDKLCNDGFMVPVSKAAVEEAGGLEAAQRAPLVFVGPYMFDEWVEGQYIRLVRNDNYWNPENGGSYKYIEYTFVADAATRAMALSSGDIDVACSLTSAQDALIESNPDLVAANGVALNNKLIYFNCSSALFDDIQVRQAVWKLIDVNAMIAVCENGKATPTEANISPGSTVYKARPDDFVREVDVEGAKELLAAAGYPDGFTVDCQYEAIDSTLAELLQAQLAEGGIKLTLSPVESLTIQANVDNGDYEMVLTASYHSDPARVLNRMDSRLQGSSGAGGFFYSSDELDALIDAAKSAFDDAERLEVYGQIQDFVIENTLCIGLYGGLTRHAASADVTNFVYNLPGNLLVAHLEPAA